MPRRTTPARLAHDSNSCAAPARSRRLHVLVAMPWQPSQGAHIAIMGVVCLCRRGGAAAARRLVRWRRVGRNRHQVSSGQLPARPPRPGAWPHAATAAHQPRLARAARPRPSPTCRPRQPAVAWPPALQAHPPLHTSRAWPALQGHPPPPPAVCALQIHLLRAAVLYYPGAHGGAEHPGSRGLHPGLQEL